MKQNHKFQSQGTNCAAWFFLPEGEGPFPLVVMAHGLAGIKEMRLDAYAAKFAEHGFACFVFDYRYFGESEGEPRQVLDINKQHQDWAAAVEYARYLKQVDRSKVILWGSSLSGGHVLKMAQELPSIAAVIAQVPHLSGFASIRMNSFSKIILLSVHGMYDKVRAWLGLQPHYVQACSEPDQLGLISAPGESKGYLNLVPEGSRFDSRVSARFVIDVALYSPLRQLQKLTIPTLVQVGTEDLTTPAQPALDVCPGNPNVTLVQYETGHFQPYVEPMFSKVVADQIAFLVNNFGSSSETQQKAVGDVCNAL